MKTLTIAPLSTPSTVTVAVMDAIKSAKKLYLQTRLHSSASTVLKLGLDFTDMDDIYNSSQDFWELNWRIADRLTSGESCTYAVMGGGCYSQMEQIEKLCNERGFELVVLSAVGYARAAFCNMQGGTIAVANELSDSFDTDADLYIEELDSPLLAGEVKLRLSRDYPDTHPVTLATLNERGNYEYQTLPLMQLDRVKTLGSAAVLRVPPVDFNDKTFFSYKDLVNIMARLRAPGGCPWDSEQTHDSLKRALIEECYELIEAIDEGDDDHMIEELGDVLMQVLFHAQIAHEQFRFDHRDVEDGLVKKLVFRHPHVFGDRVAQSGEEALNVWDAMKTKEKSYQSLTEKLSSVPKSFPALMRCQKVQKRASKQGFDWDSAQAAFYKLPEEVDELKAAMQSGQGIEIELGDVFFTLVNLARLLGLDSEDVANAATDKFISRYQAMEKLAVAEGVCLSELSLKQQDEYWSRAKEGE